MPYEKVGKNEPVCIADEIPFEIPDSWEWVTLKTIAISELGKTLDKAKNHGTFKPYLCSINVYWTGIDLSKIKEARFEENELQKYRLQKGDLLICEGGDVGRSAIWELDKEMYYQNALHRVRFYCGINPYYFRFLLECYKGNKILDERSRGMTIKHLVQSALNSIYFPLPPLAEQNRIVRSIQSIEPYINEYAEKEKTLSDLQNAFPGFLKKSILQQAVQGKLVPQNSSDEPASILLERIREEKQQLIREGKVKKDKHESIIFRRDNSYYEKTGGKERCIDDEIPFEIPKKWSWCRLKSLGITQTGNTPSKTHPEYIGNVIPFITPGDILNETIFYNNRALSVLGKNVARICPPETILQVCIGGSIGKAAITTKEIAFNQQINAITPIFVLNKYLILVMQSVYFITTMKKIAGGTATPIINRGLWDQMPIPIPPFAEQYRIVAKIEELLSLIKEV